MVLEAQTSKLGNFVAVPALRGKARGPQSLPTSRC